MRTIVKMHLVTVKDKTQVKVTNQDKSIVRIIDLNPDIAERMKDSKKEFFWVSVKGDEIKIIDKAKRQRW